jgi:hypothetical protein
MSFRLPFRSQSTKVINPCSNCKDLEPDRYSSDSTHYTRFNGSLKELHQAVSNGCVICSFVQAIVDEIFKNEGQSKIRDYAVSVATLPDWSLGSLIQQFKKNESAGSSVFLAIKSSMNIHFGVMDNEYENVVNSRTYDIVLQGQSFDFFCMTTTQSISPSRSEN